MSWAEVNKAINNDFLKAPLNKLIKNRSSVNIRGIYSQFRNDNDHAFRTVLNVSGKGKLYHAALQHGGVAQTGIIRITLDDEVICYKQASHNNGLNWPYAIMGVMNTTITNFVHGVPGNTYLPIVNMNLGISPTLETVNYQGLYGLLIDDYIEFNNSLKIEIQNKAMSFFYAFYTLDD